MPPMTAKHIDFMKLALIEAQKAAQKDEVPIGAVLVAENDELISKAHNQVIGRRDPTAHAEILALRKFAHKIHNYRLLNTTLYVTVEPCPMCMGAVIHARVAQVIFGARDPRWGAAGSLYNFAEDRRFNHRPKIIEGICADECQKLIQDFFISKRT
jgi:tRNA(adenine34) deaminase